MCKKSVKEVITSVRSMRPKPSFYLSDKDLPVIKNWEVGKQYKLKMTVKQVSKNIGEEYDEEGDNQRLSARFDILKVSEDKDRG